MAKEITKEQLSPEAKDSKVAAESCLVKVIKYDEDDDVLAEMFEDDKPSSME